MADEVFKLPGSSYSEIAKIIRAYGHAHDEATLDDVASRAAVDKTFVSRNNGFLISLGILFGGKKKSLTPEGRELSTALDHELIEKIQEAWRNLVEENEFLKKIVSAVRIRNGMDPSQLRAHIAYTAGVPKKPIAMTGSNAIIDILRQSGMLTEKDGKIIAETLSISSSKEMHLVSMANADSIEAAMLAVRSPEHAGGVDYPGKGGHRISIQINVNCVAGDLPDLAKNIKDLLSSLQNINDPNAD